MPSTRHTALLPLFQGRAFEQFHHQVVGVRRRTGCRCWGGSERRWLAPSTLRPCRLRRWGRGSRRRAVQNLAAGILREEGFDLALEVVIALAGSGEEGATLSGVSLASRAAATLRVCSSDRGTRGGIVGRKGIGMLGVMLRRVHEGESAGLASAKWPGNRGGFAAWHSRKTGNCCVVRAG